MNGMNKSELTDDERGKLFVGGLSWGTNQESLQKYFSRYGEVIDCVVMKNSESGRSRGFGFVTFADPSNVNVVLQNGPHQLDDRIIDPKACTPRSMQRSKNRNYPKVFLGGLPSNVTETELQMFFSRYGKVMKIVIMYDQEKKKSRGFGFLAFEDDESVERCCMDHFVNLNGKQIEIKRAEIRDRSNTDECGSTNTWTSGAMSTGNMSMNAPSAPPMTAIAPSSMMSSYQNWGMSHTTGYNYASGPGSYQGWNSPAGPPPQQWNSGYNSATQQSASSYGSYGPQNTTSQTRYNGSWNWNMNTPNAGQTPTSPNDLYSRGTVGGTTASNNITVTQSKDYGSYAGYPSYQDTLGYGANRSYNGPDVSQSSIMTGAGYSKPFDYKEWPAS